jgi:hypothetical protein
LPLDLRRIEGMLLLVSEMLFGAARLKVWIAGARRRHGLNINRLRPFVFAPSSFFFFFFIFFFMSKVLGFAPLR